MDVSDWFVMSSKSKCGAFVARYYGLCHNADDVLRGEEHPEQPMEFEHHMGGRVYDYVCSSHLSLKLLSSRMQSILQEGHFTGWNIVPSVIRHNKLGVLYGYGCLVVRGRIGQPNFESSPLERRLPTNENGRPTLIRVGIGVDFAKWDGSDIVVWEEGIMVMVSRAVHDTLVKSKITGVSLTCLNKYELTDWKATELLWKEMGFPKLGPSCTDKKI
jgi:hypothetical protein